jgi:hypothetical protein
MDDQQEAIVASTSSGPDKGLSLACHEWFAGHSATTGEQRQQRQQQRQQKRQQLGPIARAAGRTIHVDSAHRMLREASRDILARRRISSLASALCVPVKDKGGRSVAVIGARDFLRLRACALSAPAVRERRARRGAKPY